MFKHIFFYRLRILLRDKSLVFWTLVFPFLLSALFKLAFSGFSAPAGFRPIPVAVVQDDAYQADVFFQQALKMVSEGETRLFDLRESPDEATAGKWLNERSIIGYITVADPLNWHVAGSGLSQSLVKVFLDQYSQVAHLFETVLGRNPAALAGLLNQLRERSGILESARIGRGEQNLLLILYYAVLAMSCLHSSYYGLNEIIDVQGNLSARAARLNLVPAGKLKMFLAGLLAALCIHVSGLLIFLAYLRLVLGVEFGDRSFFIGLTMVLGSFTGLALGALVGAVLRGGENLKVAVLSTFTLIGAFLAGMMSPQVKYQVSNALPLLAWLNPVNLLADAFYALYYFDDLQRYSQNMGMLSLLVILMCAGVYLLIRRRQYVSL
jgi:ABC-2 type transport system permease protein